MPVMCVSEKTPCPLAMLYHCQQCQLETPVRSNKLTCTIASVGSTHVEEICKRWMPSGCMPSLFPGFQASLDVIQLEEAALWWAGKEMLRGKKLQDYVGRNEKTKIICKIQKVWNPVQCICFCVLYWTKHFLVDVCCSFTPIKEISTYLMWLQKGMGAPAREPVVSQEDQKAMMAFYYKKQEDFKVRLHFAINRSTGPVCLFVLPCFLVQTNSYTIFSSLSSNKCKLTVTKVYPVGKVLLSDTVVPLAWPSWQVTSLPVAKFQSSTQF